MEIDVRPGMGDVVIYMSRKGPRAAAITRVLSVAGVVNLFVFADPEDNYASPWYASSVLPDHSDTPATGTWTWRKVPVRGGSGSP